MKRRSPGAGGVDELPSGRFRVRIRNAKGKRETLGTYDTREEAETVLAAALRRLASIDEAPTGPITIRAWGADWFDQRKQDGVRGADKELSVWNRHVVPHVGDVIVREFGRAQASTWLDTLAKTKATRPARGGPKGGRVVATTRTLSRVTQTHALRLLRGAMDDAVKRGHARENPLAGVEISVRETRTTDAWTYLTTAEIDRVATCAALPAIERTIYVTAIYSGLREGELWGLRWEYVHLDGAAPELEVRFSYKGPPKGGKPRRVPLLPAARAVLRAWWESQGKPETGLVFPSREGRMRHKGDDARWSPGVRRSKRTGKEYAINGYKLRAGITRPVRFHDLRHTCASHLVMGSWGVQLSLEEVREWLGHADVTTTQRYAHLAPDHLSRRVAAELCTPEPSPARDPRTPRNLGHDPTPRPAPNPYSTAARDARFERATFGFGDRGEPQGIQGVARDHDPDVTHKALKIVSAAARREPLAQDVIRSFVLSLVAAGASGPVVVRALEPGAHQMSAVVDLAVAVLESDAATSTHKGLAAR